MDLCKVPVGVGAKALKIEARVSVGEPTQNARAHVTRTRKKLTRYGVTSREGIASVARIARANRTVVVDVAAGVSAARSWTRIRTFLIETSLVLGTFRADHAFGSTSGRRTHVSGQARAHALAVNFSALTVWTAW
jgi:hypothetical protein